MEFLNTTLNWIEHVGYETFLLVIIAFLILRFGLFGTKKTAKTHQDWIENIIYTEQVAYLWDYVDWIGEQHPAMHEQQRIGWATCNVMMEVVANGDDIIENKKVKKLFKRLGVPIELAWTHYQKHVLPSVLQTT